MTTRIFGSGIKRREDPRLITGKARYTDDMALPGMLHMAVVRSPHAHARVKRVNTAAAKKSAGVVAVFTGQDVSLSIPCAWLIPNSDLKTVAHPALAKDKVRYVGDGVAIVLAQTRYQAQDAADAVQVEYEPLPAAVNPEEATKSGAPLLFDEAPNNIAFRWIASSGDEGVEKAFQEADVVVKERIVQQRLLPTAHGAACRAGPVERCHRGNDGLVHQPESAHSPPYLGLGSRYPRSQAPRDRAGSWGRVRQQAPGLPG
jgi:carbon-monoxide dehydrogenase large subunit